MDTSLLGTLLRDRRRRAGLTQAQAAAAAQLSVRALREIEQGRVARPHPASLRRLATALHLGGADTDRLLAGLRASDPRHVDAVTVNVLGPLAVARRGAPVVIASIARQRLLGLLALESDRYVSVGEIADVIWGERLPGEWRNRVHAHVGQLRQLLEPGRPRRASSVVLPHHSDGYRLSLPEDCLDASRFRRHLAAAGEAALLPDPLSAARHYEEALSCWRGPILDGTDGALAVRPAAEALHRARVAGTLAFADLAATLGAHDRATLWLQAVAGEEPMHEGVQSRLMRALAHQGQQERALLLYGELRARLAEELGVDPAPETQAAYGEVLRMGSAGPVPQRADIPIPAQLPMATPFFAGRDEAVDRIAGHLTGPGRAAEIPAPRIVLIHGMPGIGKTALALQVAHRIRKHYPEGQLFADLRGEAESPAPADQILGGLLRSLGVAPGDIPADLDERSALLRSHLAGRRVLMVLDDARCGDQVVALLPSDRGNDVLITSRHPLHELPVTRRRLDPLDLDDSLSLLARYVPAQRLAAESPAASKVAAACAGLPLALTIAGALAHSGDSLDDIAEALAEPGLPGIRAGELGLRRSLDSACRGLSPVARTALRRLAALPTRSFAPWAVQAILDTDEGTAAEVLHEVINANLVSRSSAGPARARQHALHDLVRLHLRGLAAPDDAEAVDRAIRTWLHLADAAMRRLAHRILPLDELGLVAPQPLPPAVVGDPYAWFDGELGNLLDALGHTARRGQPRVAAGLLTALTPYLRVRQHTDVWRWATDVVIAGAQEAGDDVAWAYACESLVRLSFVTSELAASVTIAEKGLELFTRAVCAQGRAAMLYHLQYAKRRSGDVPAAMQICTALVAAQEETGDTDFLAAAHHALAVIHRDYLHDPHLARQHFERALELAAIDTASREYSQISYGLAILHIRQGRLEQAEPLLTHALTIMRANNDTDGIASMLNRLSDVRPPAGALAALDEALALVRKAGIRQTEAQNYEARSRLCERTGAIRESVVHMQRAAEMWESLGCPTEAAETAREVSRLKAIHLRTACGERRTKG